MYHFLRVLPSISALWTRKRQTLLLFAITLIKIWKQAKKWFFSSQDKFAFCLTKLGLHFPCGMKTVPYRPPLMPVAGSAAFCPKVECFLLEMAVLGSSKKTLSGQAHLFCSTLDVNENSLSSPSVLPGGWDGCSFLLELWLKTHSQDIFP